MLEYYFPIIYGDQFDDEIQRVRDICYEMLCDYNFGRMDKEANRGTCASEDVVAIDDSLVNFNNFVSQKKKKKRWEYKIGVGTLSWGWSYAKNFGFWYFDMVES